MAKCCAPNCFNSQRKDSNNYSFYCFPEEPKKRAEWISQIGRLNWTPGRRSLLCSAHFEKHFLKQTGSSPHLCENAVPTIFSVRKRRKILPRALKAVESFQSVQDEKWHGQEKTSVSESCFNEEPVSGSQVLSENAKSVKEEVSLSVVQTSKYDSLGKNNAQYYNLVVEEDDFIPFNILSSSENQKDIQIEDKNEILPRKDNRIFQSGSGNVLRCEHDDNLSKTDSITASVVQDSLTHQIENNVMMINEEHADSDVKQMEASNVIVVDGISYIMKTDELVEDMFDFQDLQSTIPQHLSHQVNCKSNEAQVNDLPSKSRNSPVDVLLQNSEERSNVILVQKSSSGSQQLKKVPFNVTEIARPVSEILNNSGKKTTGVYLEHRNLSTVQSDWIPKMSETVTVLPEEPSVQNQTLSSISHNDYDKGPQREFSCTKKYQITSWQNGTWMCRLCGVASSTTVDVFGVEAEKLKLLERIASVLPIKIVKNDGLPHSVCSTCISRLDACSQLIVTSLNTHKQLATMVGKEFDHVFDISVLHGVNRSTETSVKDMKRKILMMEICDYEEKSLEECLALAVEDIDLRLLPKDRRFREPYYKLAIMSLSKDTHFSHEEQIMDALKAFLKGDKGSDQSKPVLQINNQESAFAHKKPEAFFRGNKHVHQSKILARDSQAPIKAYRKPHNSIIMKDASVTMHKNDLTDETSLEVDLTREDHVEAGSVPNVQQLENFNSVSNISADFKSVPVQEAIKTYDLDRHQHLILPISDEVSTESSTCDVRNPKLTSVWKNRNEILTTYQKTFLWNFSLTDGVQLVCKLCHHAIKNEETPENHLRNHKDTCSKGILQPVESHRQKLWNSMNWKQAHSRYRCSFCSERFMSKPSLNRHVQEHVNTKCHGCEFKAVDFHEALAHHQTCSQLKTKTEWMCKMCMLVFVSEDKLKEHMAENRHNSSSSDWLCDTCGKRFLELQKLTKHKKIHRPAEVRFIHQCPYCPKRFEFISKLKDHKLRHEEKQFMCKECGKMFGAKQTLRQHEWTHGDPMFLCSQCSRSFYRKSHLVKHMKVHDPSNLRNVRGRRPVNRDGLNRCRECKQVFSIGELLAHYKSAHPNSPLNHYTCDICKKENTSYGELFQHQYDTHKRIVKECPFCSKILESSTQMKYHVMRHEGMYPYNCTICNNGYSSNSVLQDHIRRKHTGEKPYKCKYCSKGFPTNSALAQHHTVHKGPHQLIPCPVCNQGFKRKAHLDIHMRIHTGVKPYRCPLCERPFRQRPDCLKHIRVIHGEDPSQFTINFDPTIGVSQVLSLAVAGIELVLEDEDLIKESPPVS